MTSKTLEDRAEKCTTHFHACDCITYRFLKEREGDMQALKSILNCATRDDDPLYRLELIRDVAYTRIHLDRVEIESVLGGSI